MKILICQAFRPYMSISSEIIHNAIMSPGIPEAFILQKYEKFHMTEKIFISSIILILSTQVQTYIKEKGSRRMPAGYIEMKGTVKFFNAKKGYGFITDANGEDHFIHYSNIQMDGYRKLHKGQEVTFDIKPQDDGKTAAVNVVPVESAQTE